MREDGWEKDDACRLYAARCSASNYLMPVKGLARYLSTRYRSVPSALRFTLHDRCSHADKVSYFLMAFRSPTLFLQINRPLVLHETHPIRQVNPLVYLSIRCPPNTRLSLRQPSSP